VTRLDAIAVGDRLPTLEKTLTRPQLFRYSAITWNAHRIHYDPEYAKGTEGHPDVLVQSHLHGAVIQELLMDWVGADGELADLSWRNTGPATPGDRLSAEAEVDAIDADARTARLSVWTHVDGTRCADGTASLRFVD